MRVIFGLLSFLFLYGCAPAPVSVGKRLNPKTRAETRADFVMDTVLEITLWENYETAELCFDEARRIADRFSFYRQDSELRKFNNGLIEGPSEEFQYLVESSEKYFRITNGAFNAMFRGEGIYDFGGIAKGYAVDRMADIIIRSGVKTAMINLGGNLYLIGYPPGKTNWSIGIRDPRDPERLAGKLSLGSGAGVASSGDYERPGHIIDPATGNSVARLLSVTVTASTALEADALSTGVYVMGRERGLEFIENMSGAECVIIDDDGVWLSSGFKGKYEDLY